MSITSILFRNKSSSSFAHFPHLEPGLKVLTATHTNRSCIMRVNVVSSSPSTSSSFSLSHSSQNSISCSSFCSSSLTGDLNERDTCIAALKHEEEEEEEDKDEDEEDEEDEEEEEDEQEQEMKEHCKGLLRSWGRKSCREYPPAIPIVARTESKVELLGHTPWVLKKYKKNGRLIIQEEKVKEHEYFRVNRANGRLTLQLVHLNEEQCYNLWKVTTTTRSVVEHSHEDMELDEHHDDNEVALSFSHEEIKERLETRTGQSPNQDHHRHNQVLRTSHSSTLFSSPSSSLSDDGPIESRYGKEHRKRKQEEEEEQERKVPEITMEYLISGSSMPESSLTNREGRVSCFPIIKNSASSSSLLFRMPHRRPHTQLVT